MTSFIRFRCPQCTARIKAPLAVCGHSRACPGCGHPLVVPSLILEDAGPVLVLLEREEHFALGRPAPQGPRSAYRRQSA